MSEDRVFDESFSQKDSGFKSRLVHHTRTPYKSKVFGVIWNLKQNGYAERTLSGYGNRLKHLSKHTDLDNPDSVKRYIANKKGWSNCYKESVVNAYIHYVRFFGLSWKKPVYKRSQRLPNVPTSEQVNMIIAHSGRKYSMIFSILRDTGLRPVELYRLTLRNIDLENGVIYPESAKGGRARALSLKKSTLAMLKDYVTKSNYGLSDTLFPTTDAISHVFMRVRNRLAQRLHQPELKKFRLYDLRHHFATMLYHRTRDILLVKEKLGHRRIETTLVYTHLVDFRDEEFVVRCAKSVKEACELIENGFEYVTDLDGVKLFRKRK